MGAVPFPIPKPGDRRQPETREHNNFLSRAAAEVPCIVCPLREAGQGRAQEQELSSLQRAAPCCQEWMGAALPPTSGTVPELSPPQSRHRPRPWRTNHRRDAGPGSAETETRALIRGPCLSKQTHVSKLTASCCWQGRAVLPLPSSWSSHSKNKPEDRPHAPGPHRSCCPNAAPCRAGLGHPRPWISRASLRSRLTNRTD